MTVKINVKEKPYYEGFKVLDGNNYRITIHWNTYTENWYMNLNGINNSISINGIALLPGKDLFAPYGYRELGQLWVIDNYEANENPTFQDFGSRWTVEYTPIS
jgi:hypothetical protein